MNITLKNGPGIPKKAGSTILAPGEPGWSTDRQELYVGTADPQVPAMVGRPDNHVNVKHYGAKGDGVTDDTAAIKAAADAAVAKSLGIFFPKGDFQMKRGVNVGGVALHFFGEGYDSQITTGTNGGFRLGATVKRLDVHDFLFKPGIMGDVFGGSATPDLMTIQRCKALSGVMGYAVGLRSKTHIEYDCHYTGSVQITSDYYLGNNVTFELPISLAAKKTIFNNCTFTERLTVSGNPFDLRVLNDCNFDIDDPSNTYDELLLVGTPATSTKANALIVRNLKVDIKGPRVPKAIIGLQSASSGGNASSKILEVSNIVVNGTVPAHIITSGTTVKLAHAHVQTLYPKAKTKLFPNTASPQSIWEQHSDGVWYNNVKVA